MKSTIYKYPFTAILAQEDLKLCLLLNLVDPSIGGVLATGDKGTAKTTTVRALSQLMGEEFPFVNLPIGATEDRVLGSINLEVLINQKQTVIDKGLLAKANSGFLYIDEVNLLNDYLMDVLLDASASGGYNLEREGISQWQESRFCLVGTMNPEEGALRPQLLDRFGLSVTVNTPDQIAIRKKIAMLRLTYDSDPTLFYKQYEAEEQDIRDQVLRAKKRLHAIKIPDEVQEICARLTLKYQVEGMRADILLLKTVRAYAAFMNESQITEEMVHIIAPYVLAHRSKEYTPQKEEETPPDDSSSEQTSNEQQQTTANKDAFQLPQSVQSGLKFMTRHTAKKKEVSLDMLDQYIDGRNYETFVEEIAVSSSVKKYMATGTFEAIRKRITKRTQTNVVFLVDTSSSMTKNTQIAFIKGIIERTLMQYPGKKIQYAIVGLYQHTARIIQGFTTDSKQILKEVYSLRTGGKTNLGAAFFKVYELLKSISFKTVQLFVFTDGKINTGSGSPFSYAIETYKKYLSKIPQATIVDTENGFVKLGRSKEIAAQLQLKYLSINDL
ncbi:VWA domain-containing protein [Aquimarina sp. TRL1]|uniref:VWA domain-containing protein n=1 Tax=Aquimarina sp. (strain TRL1) TaxID=2736252 RepID=UPI00158B39D5|nr:VWA domain-containing protein [Aquimarina sp. TRL1]QKX07083.1 VWA domain-containing protein [Aquimarina sp. TRL1]